MRTVHSMSRFARSNRLRTTRIATPIFALEVVRIDPRYVFVLCCEVDTSADTRLSSFA